MKVLIVEEALEKVHGHWFQYIKDMVNGGQEAGHEIDVLTHRDASAPIKEAFGDNNVLSRSVYNRPKTDTGFRRLWAIREHNRTLFEEVRNWVEQGDKIYDVTIMPSMRVDHVLAAHDLEKHDRGRKLGLIVAIFADTVGNYDQDGQLSFPRSSLFLRLAMRFCNCAPKRPRVIFATESEGLIEQYATFCGLRLKYLPHVTSVPETLMARDQRPEGKLVMGTFGFTRYDKGTDVFHDALTAREPESFKGLEFVVQWTGDYSLPDGRRAERRPDLSDRFDLRYIDAFSRSEDYYEWLSKIDLIFLPYRENFYKAKLSRVAIDAAMVGLPIIYPKGTWLEEFANRFASGVGFEPDNPISLGEAIVNARESFDSLSRDAVRKAAEVRVHFSGQSFFKCIENFGSR